MDHSFAPYSRRHFLGLLCAALPLAAQGKLLTPPDHTVLLAAMWRAAGQYYAGIIAIGTQQWRILDQIELPSRGHGLHVLADGSLLLCARRPGDWIARWNPHEKKIQWHWLETDRFLNGHITWHPSLDQILTTQTDRETGDGHLVTYSMALEECDSYPTYGHDPHEVLLLPETWQGFPAHSVVIANGGIPTQSEYGRLKNRQQFPMDASLLVYDPSLENILHQSGLADPWLSIRHLAWNPLSQSIGIALQAEHPDPALQSQAPIFAQWQGKDIELGSDCSQFSGYGGSICAFPRHPHFLVSSPPSNALLSTIQPETPIPLAEGCPLTATAQEWFAGGKSHILRNGVMIQNTTLHQTSFEWDNHWALYPRTSNR